MTRDEFRKIAYELHCLLSGVQRTAKMISELETAYEGCTRWNEKLRAELEEVKRERNSLAKHRDEWRRSCLSESGLNWDRSDFVGKSYWPEDKLEWEDE